MIGCDGCGRSIIQTEECGYEVTTPDGSQAYICEDCHTNFGDDLENLF